MSKVKFIKPIEVTPAMVVSSSLFDTAPAEYVTGNNYSLGAYVSVTGTLGEIKIYKSLQGGNIGHPPSSSPTWWVYSSSTYPAWVFRPRLGFPAVYQLGDRVIYSNFIYESLVSDNSSVIDPINESVWSSVGTVVSPVVPASWLNTTTYSIGQIVRVDFGGNEITAQAVYKSLQNSNTGNGPSYSPTYWELIIDYPLPWLYTALYITGNVVYKPDNSLWKSLSSNNQNNFPGTTTPTWLKVQPSNLKAMFDDQTTTGSVANKNLDITVASGIITSVGLIGVNADTAKLTVRNGLGGTIVFQKTIGLSGGNASNGWDYYFSDPSVRKKQAFIDGIPPYLNSNVTLELSGIGEIGIGNFILGTTKELGIPENGLSSEMLDFSKKTTDDFGRTTFVRRGFKRTLDLQMFVDNSDIAKVESLLEDVRATPILVIASENPDYSETAIRYCFYKTFRTEISYPTFAFVSIQFEGLI